MMLYKEENSEIPATESYITQEMESMQNETQGLIIIGGGGRGDTTPPDQITGMSVVEKTEFSIKISWSSSSATDLNYYKVYRDGILLNPDFSIFQANFAFF